MAISHLRRATMLCAHLSSLSKSHFAWWIHVFGCTNFSIWNLSSSADNKWILTEVFKDQSLIIYNILEILKYHSNSSNKKRSYQCVIPIWWVDNILTMFSVYFNHSVYCLHDLGWLLLRQVVISQNK